MIPQENTICYKVSRTIDALTEALTGSLDIVLQVQRLHEIRKSAQRMEDALKLRKEMMVEAGIEAKYQSKKAGNKALKGVNKIAHMDEKRLDTPEYTVIIKQGNEIVYENKVFSIVASIVEEITDIDDSGAISGRAQSLTIGKPLHVWYGFDQLRQAIEARSFEIFSAIQASIKSGSLADKSLKKALIERANARN
jgi:hypothetical protein